MHRDNRCIYLAHVFFMAVVLIVGGGECRWDCLLCSVVKIVGF